MSTSQTLRLVGTISRLIKEYPNLNDTSKQLEKLFNTILDKIKAAVENDVFIPIFPKQLVDRRSLVNKRSLMYYQIIIFILFSVYCSLRYFCNTN